MLTNYCSSSTDEEKEFTKRPKRSVPSKDYKEKDEEDTPPSPEFVFDSDDEETLKAVGESYDTFTPISLKINSSFIPSFLPLRGVRETRSC